MNLDFLNPYMFWIKLGGAALIVIAIFGTGMWFDGTIKQHEIDGLNIKIAQKNEHDATESLKQFKADVDLLTAAAQSYAGGKVEFEKKFNKLAKDFADAIKNHPLPAGCVPDAARMLSLLAAVAAANNPSTGHVAVPAVPANP